MRGEPALVVRDDGEGVIPEMGREDALRYLAEHIGHSRKLKLSPTERRERVVAGKYGVGLLGFWSIGRRFEMRSRVGGSQPWALRLVEDHPSGEVGPLPARTDDPETFTEIVVGELHDTALRPLGGARLSTYLGAELRGQLLQNPVELVVVDRMARGLAQKRFEVRPRRFIGERLSVPAEIPAADHAPVRVELYLVRGGEPAAIQVACAGTLVADDIAELAALGLAEPPWVGRNLTGVIEFPDFDVPPGTRRGVVPDQAADAFVAAMARLKPAVEAELERLERERQSATSREVVRDLRNALRGFARRFPQYDLPSVADGPGPVARPTEAPPPPGEQIGEDEPERGALPLFPPGPLEAARIVPDEIAIAPGAERRVRAEATDADGRRIRDGVSFRWSIDRSEIAVLGEGARPALSVRPDCSPGVTAVVRVEAAAGEHRATAEATVTVIDIELRDQTVGARGGIPDPELIADPAGDWRSRYDGHRWQVNEAHEDYVALRGDARRRLRYLLALFAKEIVQRSYGEPGSDRLLERLVEVLAYAERNL